jgi:hypothetical protein
MIMLNPSTSGTNKQRLYVANISMDVLPESSFTWMKGTNFLKIEESHTLQWQ